MRAAVRLLVCCVLVGAGPRAFAAESLTLEHAIELALSRNERAGIADAQADAAQARLSKARAFFFPDFIVTGNYSPREYETRRDATGDLFVTYRKDAVSATAVATIPIFDARAFPLHRFARLERDAARYDAMEVRRRLAFEAAEAFLMALGVQQVREAAERRHALAEQSLREARARFEAKLVGSNDVTRAELELANADRERTRAVGDAQTTMLELSFLLDVEVPGALRPPDALLAAAAAPPGSAEDLVRETTARRMDVLSDRAHARALVALSREPMMRLLPVIGASAAWRVSNDPDFEGREQDPTIGVVATWPLFDGGDRYADRRERRANARVATLQARATERAVEVDLERALVRLANGQASAKAAGTAAEAARRNARETGELYRQGLVRAFEASDAQLRLFEAEVALARERYGLGIAYLGVPAALGLGPIEPPAAQGSAE